MFACEESLASISQAYILGERHRDLEKARQSRDDGLNAWALRSSLGHATGASLRGHRTCPMPRNRLKISLPRPLHRQGPRRSVGFAPLDAARFLSDSVNNTAAEGGFASGFCLSAKLEETGIPIRRLGLSLGSVTRRSLILRGAA